MSSSGNFNLTTYYAKRIIGDSAANSAETALLQTGTGVTDDTWILSRTNRATNYGIIYKYDAADGDTIEFVGGAPSGTTAWIRLDDGAASFDGDLTVGGDTDVAGALNVTGAVTILDTTASSTVGTGALVVSGGVGISGALHVGGTVNLADDLDITGDISIGGDADITGDTTIAGNTQIDGTLVLTKSTDASGTAANAVALIVGGAQTAQHLEIDNNEIQSKTTDTTVGSLSLNYDGGDIALGVNNTTYSVGVRSTKDATSTSSGALTVGGGVAVAKKLYANGIYSSGGSIIAGTFAVNTNQTKEYDVIAQSGAGKIYLFSDASATGNKGLFAKNASDTGATILRVSQENRISVLAPLVTGFDIYNNDIVRGTNPVAWTHKSIVFRSEDSSNERKQLARVMNSYSTSGANGLELVVYAPSSGTTDTEFGMQMFAAIDSNDNAYSYNVLKGCLNVYPNQEGYRQGIRVHAHGGWSELFLCGSDNTALTGTSANSWIFGNNNGNLYLTRNGSTGGSAVNFSNVNSYWRLHGNSLSSVADHYSSILHIYGNTYGNDAADIQSSYAGYMTFGDPGPQITFDTSATPGGSQAGALLFTDHDTAGSGASFHFLSNQSDWTVVSKRFHARTSISVRDAAASTASNTSGATTYIGQGSIELINSTPYIDFHHSNDTSDYTSRLISEASGLKLLTKSGLNTWLYLGNGTNWAGLCWTTFGGGWYMEDSTYMKLYNNKQLLVTSSHTTSSTNLSSQLIVSSIAYNSTLASTSGGDVAIELWRGGNASWQIINSGGNLYFKNNWTTAKQSTYTQTAITVNYNTGNTTVAGQLSVNNYIKSTLNGNTVTIGSANSSWCHFSNSANIPFYFNRTTAIDGDLGTTSYPVKNIYVGKSNGAGIYYVGSASSQRMIRFIDNANDTYGNGISIGGGGLTVLGSGESADTILSNLSLTAAGGTETTYICSDGDINFYPNNNSYDASALCKITASRFWAGVNGNTTRESQVGAQAGAGQIYIYSQAATSGGRGLYIPAHGSGSAKAIVSVDSNNNITLQGAYANVNGTKREVQIRHGTKTCRHNTGNGITFSPAFSSACFAVIPSCAQVGFGAYSTISMGDITKNGFSLFQYNSAGADMIIDWVAFGY